MNKDTLEYKLNRLKLRQKQIDRVWLKTGNRELLRFFVELIPKALNVERCSIFILDPKENNVWLQCGTGLEEKAIKVPRWSSVVGEVIEKGKPMLEEDMENKVGAHEVVAVKTGFITRNTLCVPVFGVSHHNQVTGAIQVLNKTGLVSSYTKEDQSILEQMALHLQMNIENIYLRQELSKVSQQMGKKIKLLESKIKEHAA